MGAQSDKEDRNESIVLASDRTMLANERTLAAWWRTAMTALAGSAGLAQLFGDFGIPWLIRGGASLLVALAIVILGVAFRRYQATASRVESDGVSRVPRSQLWIGTGLLALVAVVVAAAIWHA